jgi:hypothetical protein
MSANAGGRSRLPDRLVDESPRAPNIVQCLGDAVGFFWPAPFSRGGKSCFTGSMPRAHRLEASLSRAWRSPIGALRAVERVTVCKRSFRFSGSAGAGCAFFVVALMVSLGTMATLGEPWIYSAIIDNIAGVLVAHGPAGEVENILDRTVRSVEHWPGALGRVLSPPMVPFEGGAARRTLESRQPREAAATVILGAILLVALRLTAERFKRLGDNRATTLATELERDFIVRTFTHVIHLPLSFFTRRASGMVARQFDQSGHVRRRRRALLRSVGRGGEPPAAGGRRHQDGPHPRDRVARRSSPPRRDR